jgi:ABC-type transport system involved in multi-copper enzyme maturation permease subunit
VIAAREFEEKRKVAFAAVAFAILPFLLGVTPGLHGKSSNEAISISSLIFATCFAVALAVMTGSSLVGRDLSDGRMSFYFSRPVSPASIWFGKLTAGILMVVGCFGVIVTPAWLVAGRAWKSIWTMTLVEGSGWVLLVALSLFLIAHVISTFTRSRSSLIAADFVAAVLCGVVIWSLVLPLARGAAFTLIKWLLILLGVALAAGIIGGGAWQLQRGRTDRRRNHFALSQFLWSVMAVVLVIAAAYVGWVVSATPGDLTSEVYATRSPGGPFVTIAGKTAGRSDYTAAWLLNADDGRKIRLDARSAWSVHYTRDGRSAFWSVVDGNAAGLRRYTQGDEGPIDTGLTVWGDFIFPSDDGSRVATLKQGTLSIYDVAQKRSLVSARVPFARTALGCFLSPDRFRLYEQCESGLQIFEVDVRTHTLRQTGGIPGTRFVAFSLDPAGSRMVASNGRSNALTLNDAATGVVLTTLLNGAKVSMAHILRDGRIVIVDAPDGAAVMHLFTSGGSLIRDIPLPGSIYARFAGDDGTRVVLMTGSGRDATRLIAVNLDRGSIEQKASDVRDWVGAGWLDVRSPIEPLREVIYKDMQNHLVAWSPATGATRRIAGWRSSAAPGS